MNRYALLFHKFLWNVKEQGAAELIRHVIREISRETFSGGQHLFSVRCAELPEPGFYLPDSLIIERFQSREAIPRVYLDKLAEFISKKYMSEETVLFYLERLLGLFDDGAFLSIAMVDNRIGAYLWSLRSKGNYQRYFPFFPLTNEDGVVFAGLTHPGLRGQNLLPALIRFNIEALWLEGVRQVFASCKVWNESSRHGIIKGGMQWIGTARVLQIFNRRIVAW
jgi:hypothetical protein